MDRFVISHESSFLAFWNFIITILSIISSYYYVALGAFGKDNEYSSLVKNGDQIFISFFAVDILIRLNVNYYDKFREKDINT